MEYNKSLPSFQNGVLGRRARERRDRPFYETSLAGCINMLPELLGPVSYRPGFIMSHPTRKNQKSFINEFVYSAAESYILEWADKYLRIHTANGVLTNPAKDITSISAAGLVTSTAHGLTNESEVFLFGEGYSPYLSSLSFHVNRVDANSFYLVDKLTNDTVVLTEAYGAGSFESIYEIATPFALEHVPNMRMATTANRAYVVCAPYAPYILTYNNELDWTITVQKRTADPFLGLVITSITKTNPAVVTTAEAHGFIEGDIIQIDGARGMTEINGLSFVVGGPSGTQFALVGIDSSAYGNYTASSAITTLAGAYPRQVLLYNGRLYFSGISAESLLVVGSRGPNVETGAVRYNDFTKGADDNSAVYLYIASSMNRGDVPMWMEATPKFIALGTFGSVFKIDGGEDNPNITPANRRSVSIDIVGARDSRPVFTGRDVVYIERGGQTLRSFQYSFYKDAYEAIDKSLLSPEITYPGLTQVSYTSGRPDIFWCVRSDGALTSSMIYSDEDIASWAVHSTQGNFIYLASMPRSNGFDRLYSVVERDGRYTLEYLETSPQLPERNSFYTGNKAIDSLRYKNRCYEIQKRIVRVDAARVHSGYRLETLTLSATTGEATVTTSSDTFEADWVGKLIRVAHIDGLESGYAEIIEYIDAREIKILITQDFSTDVVDAWYLSTRVIRGLYSLEGKRVNILADSMVHPPLTVTDGEIYLEYEVFYAIIGLGYFGYLETLDLDFGTIDANSAAGRDKQVNKVVISVIDSLGGRCSGKKLGYYEGKSIVDLRAGRDDWGRAPVPVTGMVPVTLIGDSELVKKVYITQDDPLPLTIAAIVPFMDVNEEVST